MLSAVLQNSARRLAASGGRIQVVEDRIVDSRLSRRKLLRGAAAVAGGVVGGAALAACTPTTTAPGTGAPSAAPSATLGPRKGGSVIIASGDALVPDLSYGQAFGPQG